MDIKVNIANNSERRIYYKGRIYPANHDITYLLGVEDYKQYEKFGDLELEIKDLIYNDLKDLTVEEIRVIAEYEGIENYWSKNKDTLIDELEDNEQDSIELEGKVDEEDTKNIKRGEN